MVLIAVLCFQGRRHRRGGYPRWSRHPVAVGLRARRQPWTARYRDVQVNCVGAGQRAPVLRKPRILQGEGAVLWHAVPRAQAQHGASIMNAT